MSQYQFGAGNFFGVMPGPAPTPIRLAGLQDVTIDFKGNIKELYGQNQFALATAKGQVKVTGKAKFANISVSAYNTLFFGQEKVESGQIKFRDNHILKIPDTGDMEIDIPMPAGESTAKWHSDMGIIDAATGKIFTRIDKTGTPAALEYKIDDEDGTYTFSADDKEKTIYVSYLYEVKGKGKTLTLYNQQTGLAPTFKGIFTGQFSGKQLLMILNACTSNSLKMIDTKLEDFSVPEMEFSASVDDAGVLGTLSAEE